MLIFNKHYVSSFFLIFYATFFVRNLVNHWLTNVYDKYCKRYIFHEPLSFFHSYHKLKHFHTPLAYLCAKLNQLPRFSFFHPFPQSLPLPFSAEQKTPHPTPIPKMHLFSIFIANLSKVTNPIPIFGEKHTPLIISSLTYQQYQNQLGAISKAYRRQGEGRAKGERRISVTSLNIKYINTTPSFCIIRNKIPKTPHFPHLLIL